MAAALLQHFTRPLYPLYPQPAPREVVPQNSQTAGFVCLWCQGALLPGWPGCHQHHTGCSGYLDTWTPRYLDTWTPGHHDSWTPGYLDTWIPGHPAAYVWTPRLWLEHWIPFRFDFKTSGQAYWWHIPFCILCKNKGVCFCLM